MPATFSPSLTDKLIKDLADPDITLRDVAEIHGTNLDALTLWMTRPDVTDRLKNFTDAVYYRVRLTAITYMATTVGALNTMIASYVDEERHIPVNPVSIADREQRRRARETARKAISLLARLAHLPSAKKKRPAKAKDEPSDEPEAHARSSSPQSATPQTPSAPALLTALPRKRPSGSLSAIPTPRDLLTRAGQSPFHISPIPAENPLGMLNNTPLTTS